MDWRAAGDPLEMHGVLPIACMKLLRVDGLWGGATIAYVPVNHP